jgi:hypothetical protein
MLGQMFDFVEYNPDRLQRRKQIALLGAFLLRLNESSLKLIIILEICRRQ